MTIVAISILVLFHKLSYILDMDRTNKIFKEAKSMSQVRKFQRIFIKFLHFRIYIIHTEITKYEIVDIVEK